MTHLLPLLKFIIPVAGLTVVGGGVYFIGGIVPKKDPGKPLPGIYLLVSGSVAQTNHTKTLTTQGSDGKITKNYKCQLSLDNNLTKEDTNCSLFNLYKKPTPTTNTTSSATSNPPAQPTTTIQESININKYMFEKSNLTSAQNSVTTSSHHILKVSQDFYDALLQQTVDSKKAIKLVDTAETSKDFGSVKEVVKLNFKTETDIKDPRVTLFLARVTATANSLTGSATTPLSCQIADGKPIKCNVYSLSTTDVKRNDLSKEKLSSLTAVTTLTTNTFTKDNYVVVEFLDNSNRLSELKNKTITISKTTKTPSASDKVGEFIFDQLLVGKVAATPSSSTIFPLTQKRAAYLVQKKTVAENSFTNITGSTSKNYKCKFTVNKIDTFDDSCTLQSFPADVASRTYQALTTSTTKGFTEINSSDTDKTNFLLTLDSNKLHNLRPNWTNSEDVDVVVVVNKDSPEKTISFTLQQELKIKKAIGKTDLVFVKYHSSETITTTIADGKCALTNAAKSVVPCSLKKATMQSNLPNSFADVSSSSSETFSSGNYYALKFDSLKNVKEFDGENIYFYTTNASTKQKITFQIIATMGGDVATSKIYYFLEPFRDNSYTPTNTSTQ